MFTNGWDTTLSEPKRFMVQSTKQRLAVVDVLLESTDMDRHDLVNHLLGAWCSEQVEEDLQQHVTQIFKE